jgi:hypothetical protein
MVVSTLRPAAMAQAQMRRDELEFAERAAQVLGGLPGDKAMAGAVKAIAPDAMPLVQLVGQGVQKRLGLQRLMERGVEHRHVGQLGKAPPRRLDAQQVGGVVQRCQLRGVADRRHAGLVQDDAVPKGFAPVHDAMTDRGDRKAR